MKKTMQGAVAPTALADAGESMALGWVSNSVGFRCGQQFINPSNLDKFAERIHSFAHVDDYRCGSNFFNLDVFLSDSRDPREGTDHGGSEVHTVYRHQLYTSRVFDWPLGAGLVKDYAFILSFDASRSSNLTSAKRRTLVFGLTPKFNGPGVLNLSLLYYREKNHFGVPGARHPDHTFNTTYMLNLTWMQPFKAGNRTVKLQGFVSYMGEEDKDHNNEGAVAETLARTALMVAALPGDKRQSNLWLGVGYEYWHNKFDVDGGTGNQTSTPTLNMEFTF